MAAPTVMQCDLLKMSPLSILLLLIVGLCACYIGGLAGYLIGNYLGGKLATNVSDDTLRKIFAVFMLVGSIKMLFFTNGNGH